MHELLKQQKSFYNSIFKDDVDLSFISSNFPQERFDIYRQTIFDNMINALRITYPGIWKLLGVDCANAVAYGYSHIEKNLSKTGCLDDFGGDFPAFLSTLEQLSGLPYLEDYAHYEWLKHLAYIDADSKPIDPSDLMNISEDEIDHITFHFCPSSHLFHSKYPLFDIYEVVENIDTKEVKLEQKKSYGVISRQENEIHTYWIREDNWYFIKKLFEGLSLLESAEYAQTINNNFDLSSAIAFVLQAQLVNNIVNKGGKNAY